MTENTKFITKDFAKDEILFTEGDIGDFIYIIISGSIDVHKEVDGKQQFIVQLSSGDILGEMAVLTDSPRCATGIAVEPTKVIMVRDRTLRQAMINDELPIIKSLINQLILRFKDAEQRANHYSAKVKTLQKEVALLKESLLQYELSKNQR